ncbi:MAG: glycerol kinase, partial [Spirochaetales bacterium]|nr:glycerol kinase [Spirochaetales bacterium]
ERVDDTAGCYVVPAFTGLGAPYWKQDARGLVVGLTRGCSRANFIRATLESLAYQSYDIAKSMEQDAGLKINSLRVDGGASANDFLMQFQSDILDSEVVRPKCIETTALGAAYLAGLATGYWENKEDIRKNWGVDRKFEPQMSAERREKAIGGWKKAVKTAIFWAEN